VAGLEAVITSARDAAKPSIRVYLLTPYGAQPIEFSGFVAHGKIFESATLRRRQAPAAAIIPDGAGVMAAAFTDST
jgi:hypothetical protein